MDEYTVVLAGGRTKRNINIDEEIAHVEIQALGHPTPGVFYAELLRLLSQSDKERRHARVRAEGRREG